MKRSLFILMLVSLLIVAVVPLSAQDSAADPRTLAGYLPTDTFAYIGIRTDQAYLETLNDLISTVAAATGEEVPEGGALGAFSALIERETDGKYTYETAIRSWLGDSAAIAVVDLQQTTVNGYDPLVIAEVADRQALRDFLASPEVNLSNLTIEEGDGFTYYKHESTYNASLLLLPKMLYVGSSAVIDSVFTGRMGESLANNPKFIAAYDALPADNYNLFGYLNGAALVETFSGFTDPNNMPFPIDFEKLEAAVNVQAFGGTIFEDRTFALDLALIYGDATIADAVGLPNLPEFGLAPVNPDFASVAPIDTFLYVGGTNNGSSALIMFDYLDALAPALAKMAEANDADTAREIRVALPAIVNVVRGFITDAMGVPFADLMAMTDGQNAMFTRYSNETKNYETAQIYENLRPDLNESVLVGVQNLLTRFDVPFESADGRVTVDMDALNAQFSDTLDMDMGMNPFALGRAVFTISPEYLVGGTPDAVNFVMGGSRIARLNSTPAYQHEAKFFLSNANQVWYLTLTPLMGALPEQAFDGAEAFDSFAMTTAEGDGAALMRLTMTLKAK